MTLGAMLRKRGFAVFLMLLALVPVGLARAQDSVGAPAAVPAPTAPISPYVISDLLIDVSAENAVKAREKAFAEALSRSYGIMLERLIPNESERATLRAPDAADLGGLLADFTTKNEQLGPTRYTATYEMRFKPRAVQTLIAAGGGKGLSAMTTAAGVAPAPEPTNAPSAAPTTLPGDPAAASPIQTQPVTRDEAHDNILILPFYQPGAHPVLWSGVNPLREALQRANLEGTKIKAPLGDLEDVQAFDETHTLSYTPMELSALLGRYGAGDAIIAIAVPNGATDAEGVHSNVSDLSVLLYRASAAAPQPKYLQALSVSAKGVPTPVAVYTRAIDKIRVMIPVLLAGRDEDIKAAAATAATPEPEQVTAQTEVEHDLGAASPQSMQLRAHYNDLQEWQQIRARLNGIPGVQTIRVMSLKTREARLELIYSGPDTGLLDQLKGRGFETAQVNEGGANEGTPDGFEPASGPLPSTGVPVLYDLTFNPWLASGGQVIKP